MGGWITQNLKLKTVHYLPSTQVFNVILHVPNHLFGSVFVTRFGIMLKNLYIAAIEPSSGKSLVLLGLMEL
ncbi:MAG: hypothetical protein ACP5RH_14735, partial [Leptodesmis sp.]|uniref:hypothetical protein n=1 Tax=Leptodesmis sp. TaxID=3100501 RepID=UPI003D0FA226